MCPRNEKVTKTAKQVTYPESPNSGLWATVPMYGAEKQETWSQDKVREQMGRRKELKLGAEDPSLQLSSATN